MIINGIKICKILYLRVSLGITLLAFNFILVSVSYAEGTKQVRPSASDYGRIVINPSFNDFAVFNGSISDRLNIKINNAGEKINIGFGNIYEANEYLANDLLFRIIAPDGSYVYGGVGGTSVPTSGVGYVQSYAAAVAGPLPFTGGYSAIAITATMAGDYRIEFSFPNMYDFSARREIDLFDVTVIDNNGNAANGRLWSKAWQFSVGVDQQNNNPYTHPFRGTLFVYADDGVVSKLNFNSIQPLVFLVSCNKYGVSNTGDFNFDRKSVAGKSVIPQYKIFLNDPDIMAYPTGTFGTFTEEPQFVGCNLNSMSFKVNVSSSGTVKIFLDLNGVPGYQTGSEDVDILFPVTPGVNTLIWNGIDGTGNLHQFTNNVEVVFTFISGLTNLPMYDIEYNRFGFKVQIVRPAQSTPVPPLFWDDSNLGGGIELGGCMTPSGCHLWDGTYDDFNGVSSIGNENTVNTWWYASQNVTDTIVIHPTTLNVQISDVEICAGNETTLSATGALTYVWSSEPADSSLIVTENPVTVSPFQTTTYYVSGTDNRGCIGVDSAQVIILQGPVLIPNNPSVCKGDSAKLMVSGGVNFEWAVSQSNQSSITVLPQSSTAYSVTGYSPQGCSSSATVDVTVWTLPEVTLFPDSLCLGDWLDVEAHGAANYQWSTGQTTNPIHLSPSITTRYFVTGTDIHGCKDSASAWISVLALPEVFAGYDTTVCAGQKVFLSAWGNAVSYIWENGDTSRNTVVYPAVTHGYEVIGTDSNSCKNRASVMVTAVPLPRPAIHADPDILSSDDHRVMLTDISQDEFLWRKWFLCDGTSGTEQTLVHDFGEDFSGECFVNLIVSNDFGCVDSIRSLLVVRPFQTMYIPTAFSPNGDGTNDVYHFFGKNLGGAEFYFRIFDRWGKMVFYTTQSAFEWDGRYGGSICPPGIYNYRLEYIDSDLKRHEKTGFIYLMR